jgi:(2Fe-2S) ferredoxin
MPKPKKHVLVCVQGRPNGHPRGSCQEKGCGRPGRPSRTNSPPATCGLPALQLTNTGCLGPCHLGPSVLVYPEGIMYTGVKPEDVGVIIDEHLMFDQPVERLLAPADVWA